MCNDFSKVFDKTVDQNAITSSCKTKKRNCHRDSMMWDAEIMSILILFTIPDNDAWNTSTSIAIDKQPAIFLLFSSTHVINDAIST